MNKILKITFYISITFQILSILITYKGMFKKISNDDKPLKNSLIIENIVQYVEFIFYLIMIYSLNSIKLNLITPRRYIDWVITTPTMLISTIMYMKYTELRDNDKLEKKELNAENFVSENTNNITSIVVYNLFMLFFGYLGEAGYLSKYISIPIGFGFFIKSFQTIYNDYAVKSDEGIKLFTFMFSIWSLYGVAAALPANAKNTSYNILDIIAKNFYGLYIYYTIYKVSLQN